MKKYRRFLSRPQNIFALAIVVLFCLIAIAAPVLAPSNSEGFAPNYQLVNDPHGLLPQPPGPGIPLGSVPTNTPTRQIDVYYTIIWGTRSALQFGLTVALITAAFGVFIGAASAYLGGIANNIIMRITDAFLAFPIIVGVVFFQQIVLLLREAAGGVEFFQGMVLEMDTTVPPLVQFLSKIDPVMLAVIVFSWMIYARITNTTVMTVKQSDYVVAAQAIGAGHRRIIFRHLIPNSISPAIILMAKEVGGLVLLQAAFTFIGIGGNSPWGQLLAFSRRYIIGPGGNIFTYWWTFLPVTIAIILFGVGFNLLGDGLSDWLNPRSVQHFEM